MSGLRWAAHAPRTRVHHPPKISQYSKHAIRHHDRNNTRTVLKTLIMPATSTITTLAENWDTGQLTINHSLLRQKHPKGNPQRQKVQDDKLQHYIKPWPGLQLLTTVPMPACPKWTLSAMSVPAVNMNHLLNLHSQSQDMIITKRV